MFSTSQVSIKLATLCINR